MLLLSFTDFFQNLFFQKSFSGTISVSNALHPDQIRLFEKAISRRRDSLLRVAGKMLTPKAQFATAAEDKD